MFIRNYLDFVHKGHEEGDIKASFSALGFGGVLYICFMSVLSIPYDIISQWAIIL